MQKHIKVSNMVSSSGNPVPNQFIIKTDAGTYFQSYKSIIAFIGGGGVTLDSYYWDYSVTTSKYRNQFLRSTTKETKQKIKNGTYRLEDLN